MTATQRVRSESTASTAAAGSSSVSRSGSAKRTSAPARAAAMSHGATLASWSRRVQTISSPGCSVRHDGRGEAHRQRGHRRAEDDALGGRAEQARDRGAGLGDERVGALGGLEGAAVVGVVARAHPGRHLLDGVVDHLGAGGAVEAGPAVGEAGEAGAVHGSGTLVACRAMPQAAVDGISLYYERRGAGEPVLLIQGMSGTHLAWGDAVPRPAWATDLDVVPTTTAASGTSTPQDRAVHHRPARRRRRGPARRARVGARPRGGDLDGRHGGPGARAAPPAADPHADARLHLPGRRGGAARRPGAHPGAGRRAALGRPRAGAAHGLRGQLLGRLRGRRGQLGAVPGDGHRRCRSRCR